MRLQLMITLAMYFVISQTAGSEELNVQSLSDGACWYEQTETIKVVSFNDKEAFTGRREDIEARILELIKGRNKGSQVLSELLLHCGGYGASFIAKINLNGAKACVWMKSEKGVLSVRSFGGLEESKSESCDGYKWGELLVGISSDQVDGLRQELLNTYAHSITAIASNMIKITLKKDHVGKEEVVASEIRKISGVKYVELNFFQHPVGEAAVLK